MSPPTLYAPDAASADPGAEVDLEPDETSHLRALRLRAGDDLAVADGRGGLWLATLVGADASGARVRLRERTEPAGGMPVELAFGVANKSRTLWLVEKAVELGVRTLQPLEFARSRSVADAGRSRGFWEKARRRAVAAMKQCGGARVPEIRPVLEVSRWLDRGGDVERLGQRLLASPDAPRTLLGHLVDRGWRGETPLALAVGPEGGLEEDERAACLDRGVVPVSLGPRTLRFETAALACLSVAAQAAHDASEAAPDET